MNEDTLTFATPRTEEAAAVLTCGGPTPKPFIVSNQNGRLHVSVYFSFPDPEGKVSKIVHDYKANRTGGAHRTFFENYNKLMTVVKKEREDYMRAHAGYETYTHR